MEKDNRSLFDIISSAVKDGKLPDDFSLPKDSKDGLIFADGAQDGISIYHTRPEKIAEEDYGIMAEALKAAGTGDHEKTDKLFLKLAERCRAIGIMSELRSYVIGHKDELKADDIYECGKRLMLRSENTECVKYGLILLELFETDKYEKLKEEVRIIGLSEEFTLYAIDVMSHWTGGNEEIFELAKKTHGWGRIHAIERLEPETPEIRKWLLTEAVNNDVIPAYSALTCFEKGQADKLLKSDMDHDTFSGIASIFAALLDEGPVSGISAIENRDEVINDFLGNAIKLSDELMLTDYETIQLIREYYADRYSDRCPITMTCRKLLITYHARCVILDALKEGKNVDLALKTGVDVRPYVLKLLKDDFRKHCHFCRYLADSSDFRKELLDISRNSLPLEDMKTAPGTAMGFGEEYWKQRALEFLMQELRNYPFEGEDFIMTGLMSGPIRTRNGAITVLKSWVEKKGKPLSDILPDFDTLLKQLRDIEPVDSVKEDMDRLLNGEICFTAKTPVISEEDSFSKESLDILSDAISDIGSWSWWYADDDMIQVEFVDVELYDGSTEFKGPHSSMIALRFEDGPFAAFVDKLEKDTDKKWHEKLKDDEIEPFDVETLDFNDAQTVNDIFEEYQNKTYIKDLPKDPIVTPRYMLACRCHDVGFVVCGNRFEVITHHGELKEKDIKKLSEDWWNYWKDYWRKRGTDEAYEKDRACELTIPVKDNDPKGNWN